GPHRLRQVRRGRGRAQAGAFGGESVGRQGAHLSPARLRLREAEEPRGGQGGLPQRRRRRFGRSYRGKSADRGAQPAGGGGGPQGGRDPQEDGGAQAAPAAGRSAAAELIRLERSREF